MFGGFKNRINAPFRKERFSSVACTLQNVLSGIPISDTFSYVFFSYRDPYATFNFTKNGFGRFAQRIYAANATISFAYCMFVSVLIYPGRHDHSNATFNYRTSASRN